MLRDRSHPADRASRVTGAEQAGTMKAVVCTGYGSPDVLELREVTTPAPGDHEVLIRVRVTTVAAEDTAFRRGDPFVARVVTGGLMRPRKTILGGEFAGEIEAAGKAVTRFKKGDQVFGHAGAAFGAYAEYLCLPE